MQTTAPTSTPTPTSTSASTTKAPTTSAPASTTASSSSGSSNSAADNLESSYEPDESGAGTVAPADLTTLAPIAADSDEDDEDDSGNASSIGTSSSTSSSASLGGWKLALIISGILCAVVASLFFVRFQNKRGRVFKRARGSSQQRALDSFFRQNRVTLMQQSHVHASSQLAFHATGNGGHFAAVPAPLTPPEDIPVTSLGVRDRPVVVRPRGQTADLIAGPQADMFSRATTRSGASSTRSYSDYDSFTGMSFGTTSNHSSSVYDTPSERSDSVTDSSTNRSRRFFSQMSSGDEGRTIRSVSSASFGDMRATQRSDRSSSDFSVFNTTESVDSIDDQSFVSITLPSTISRPDSIQHADSGSSSLIDSIDDRDSYDSIDDEAYHSEVDSIHRVSELSEGEI